jgi:hypothetical protein
VVQNTDFPPIRKIVALALTIANPMRDNYLAISPYRGPVAQLGARFHGMEEVVGSIPTRSTNSLPCEKYTCNFAFLQPTALRNGAIIS